MRVLIFIPTYNEKANIGKLIDKLNLRNFVDFTKTIDFEKRCNLIQKLPVD